MQNLKETFDKLLDVSKTIYGPAKYKYEKIYHSYKRGRHWVTCGEQPQITRNEYLKEKEVSQKLHSDAFWGKNKSSYYEYRQILSEPGYLQLIMKMLVEEIKKEEDAPAENIEASANDLQQPKLNILKAGC